VLPADILLAPRLESLEAKLPLVSVPGRSASKPSSAPAAAASGVVPVASAPGTAPSQPVPSKPLPGTDRLSPFPVPTGWDSAALAEVERELAQHVGPVARVLVRRAARGLNSLAAVRLAVAGAIVDFESRERFLAKAGAPGPYAAPAVPTAAGHLQVTAEEQETPAGVPMREGDVDKAAAALLALVGPIARVVVKRCAARSQTREQFVAHVVGELTPSVDARRVQTDLWRAFG
jgi:serine/threonine-protein kinase